MQILRYIARRILFVIPQLFGIIKDTTGSDFGGLLFLAACAVMSVVLVLTLGHNPALERPELKQPQLKPAK